MSKPICTNSPKASKNENNFECKSLEFSLKAIAAQRVKLLRCTK